MYSVSFVPRFPLNLPFVTLFYVYLPHIYSTSDMCSALFLCLSRVVCAFSSFPLNICYFSVAIRRSQLLLASARSLWQPCWWWINVGGRFGCVIPPNPQPKALHIVQSQRPHISEDGEWRSMPSCLHRRFVVGNLNQVQTCVKICSTHSGGLTQFDISWSAGGWRLHR